MGTNHDRMHRLADRESEGCLKEAVSKLKEAVAAIESGDDMSDGYVAMLLLEAQMSLGEARGYRNAVYDILEDHPNLVPEVDVPDDEETVQ